MSLDEIYATSDYISLHTNLTPETRDLISAKSFAKMKQRCFDFELRARRDCEHQ